MNYTLITGASKGIGKSFAMECAHRNMNLLLIARNENLLRSLATELINSYKIDVKFIALDLTLEKSCLQIFEYINEKNISINCLINNAGSGCFGNFGASDLGKNLDVIKLNIEAYIKLTYLYLAHYDKTQTCYLLNVISTAAFQPIPNFAIYAASKSFILSFTKSLQYEYRSGNLVISALCPGGTDSEFFKDARMDHIFEQNKKWLMKPSQIASIGMRGMLNRKKLIIPGFNNKLHIILLKIIPDSFILYFTARIYK